jgi:hypothetical protein
MIIVTLFHYLWCCFFSPTLPTQVFEKDVRSQSICPHYIEVELKGDSSTVKGFCFAADGSTILLYVNGVLSNSVVLQKGTFVFEPTGVTLFEGDEVCVSTQTIGKTESERMCQ